jgi:glycosyltransferase involved in cell wall biosynthesis
VTAVSVVLTTYNRPEFLAGAIETAVGQTEPPSEVIVVDGGSRTDYAMEVVTEYPDSVRLIRHTEPRGLSATRNVGIDATNGEYVAFLDDDDRWHRSKLERQVRELRAKPDAGLVTCGVVRGPPGGPPRYCDPAEPPTGDLESEVCVGNPVGEPSRIVVRRECLTDVGTFDESLETREDWEFYLRLCQRWDVAAVDEHLVYLSQHSGNLSSDVEKAERDRMRITRKHEPLIRHHHDWADVLRSYHGSLGRRYLDVPDAPRARAHLRSALGYDVSVRLLLLYLLASAPSGVARRVIAAKQAVDPRVGCRELTVEVSPETFPGLGAGTGQSVGAEGSR